MNGQENSQEELNRLALTIKAKDFPFPNGFGEQTDFVLLKISEHVSGKFYALFLKSSDVHQGAYERLGVVRGGRVKQNGGEKEYDVLTACFANAAHETGKIV